MRVSIITVNYNGYKDTIAMGRSLQAAGIGTSYELIVVDNGSRAGDAEKIRKALPWATVIATGENLGFAGGCNAALDYVTGDKILYLNNDTLAEDDFLTPMVEFMDSNLKCGALSPKILYENNRRVHFAGYSSDSHRLRRITPVAYNKSDAPSQRARTPFAHGAAMMTRSDIISTIGAMREDYFLYFEEIEYSIRIERAGLEIWYLPESHVLHKGSATIGGVNPSSIYYSARGYLMLIKDTTSGWQRTALLAEKLTLAPLKSLHGYIAKGEWRVAKSYLKAICHFIIGKRGRI